MYTPPGHRSRLVTALCCALLVGGCGEGREFGLDGHRYWLCPGHDGG